MRFTGEKGLHVRLAESRSAAGEALLAAKQKPQRPRHDI